MDSPIHDPEVACWGAVCTALASVAPRYGVLPEKVRELCLAGASLGDDDIEQVQFMSALLVQEICQNGASRDELLQVARQAFMAHRLTQDRLTVSDLFPV